MKNLAGITARYIDRPFSDFGCIELVARLLDDIGTPLPAEVNGIDQVNYHLLVDLDIKAAQNTMLEIFSNIGCKGDSRYPSIGNLLVIEQPGDVYFPAVYVGGGQAIASFVKKGVCVFNIDNHNRVCLCRRLD